VEFPVASLFVDYSTDWTYPGCLWTGYIPVTWKRSSRSFLVWRHWPRMCGCRQRRVCRI